MDSGRDEQIRKRAHEIWEQEGRPEGKEREHWERAEREIGEGAEGITGKSPFAADQEENLPPLAEVPVVKKKRTSSNAATTKTGVKSEMARSETAKTGATKAGIAKKTATKQKT
jgi:hypothetical protein